MSIVIIIVKIKI